ncbi:MAG: beta-ketoacyl-ACP synthase III [Gammaproteobacteria bacterium]|nr:beta-ketoacyl-ACP synthase III [Gammaproteobacteria bacterium]
MTDFGAFFPNAPVDNHAMEAVLGMVGGKPSRARRLVLARNGIKQRHYAIDPQSRKATHTNADMTAQAIRSALHRAGVGLEQMACLACGTSSPDQLKPAHAHMVHGVLQAPPMEIGSITGVCTAGITAMKYAWMTVATGGADLAVSTGSELASSFMRAEQFGAQPDAEPDIEALEKMPVLAFEEDFLRWMLSDAAGAAVLQSTPGSRGLSLRIDWIDCVSYAGELPACMYSGANKDADGRLRGWREVSPEIAAKDRYFAVKQDARLLDEYIIEVCLTRALGAIAARRKLDAGTIDWFLPHYSSAYFRAPLYKALMDLGLQIPYDRWFTNLASRGNVGSAMIYVILEELFYSGMLKKGQRLLCVVPESARFSVCYMHLTVV